MTHVHTTVVPINLKEREREKPKKEKKALAIEKKDRFPEALTEEVNDKLFELRFQVRPEDYDKLHSLLRRYEERVPERVRDHQKSAIEELRGELQALTSSVHWKPKLLGFIKPYYEALEACYESMDDSDSRKYLADILSVLVQTTTSSPGETIKYRLLGSGDVLRSWGPGYVKCTESRIRIRCDDCEGDCEGNCRDACWSDCEDVRKAPMRDARAVLNRSKRIYEQLEKIERFDGDLVTIDGVRAFPTYGPGFIFNPATHGTEEEYIRFDKLAMKLAKDACEYNNCIKLKKHTPSSLSHFHSHSDASMQEVLLFSVLAQDVDHQLVFQRLIKAVVYPQQHFFITLVATHMGNLKVVQAEVNAVPQSFSMAGSVPENEMADKPTSSRSKGPDSCCLNSWESYCQHFREEMARRRAERFPKAATEEGNDKLFELRFQVRPEDYDKLHSLLRRFTRLVQDPDHQNIAIEELRGEIQALTSSIHWKPKPLDFVKPYYEDLEACYKSMDDSDSRKYLADILSVLAQATSPGEGIKYRLLGSGSVLRSWGPGYIMGRDKEIRVFNLKDCNWAGCPGSDCKGDCGGIDCELGRRSNCKSECDSVKKAHIRAGLALQDHQNEIYKQLEKVERFDADLITTDGLPAFPTYGPGFRFNRATHGTKERYIHFYNLALKLAKDASEYYSCIKGVDHQLVFQRLIKAIVFPSRCFYITLVATHMGNPKIVRAEVVYGSFYMRQDGVEFIIHKILPFDQAEPTVGPANCISLKNPFAICQWKKRNALYPMKDLLSPTFLGEMQVAVLRSIVEDTEERWEQIRKVLLNQEADIHEEGSP
ncbi:hypothetical protein Tsubulata_043000, partial [Turnera subulata]